MDYLLVILQITHLPPVSFRPHLIKKLPNRPTFASKPDWTAFY